MVVSVNKDDIVFYLILLVIDIILLLIYAIYIIIDERKKWKKKEFFKYTLRYEVDYFLYFDMVKKMKIIIFKKKLELFWLNILLLFRRLILWKRY